MTTTVCLKHPKMKIIKSLSQKKLFLVQLLIEFFCALPHIRITSDTITINHEILNIIIPPLLIGKTMNKLGVFIPFFKPLFSRLMLPRNRFKVKPVCQINLQGISSLPLVHSEAHHPLTVVKIRELREDIISDLLLLKPNLFGPSFTFGFTHLEFDNDSEAGCALHLDTSPHILNKLLETISFHSFIIKPEGDRGPFDTIRDRKN